MPKNPSPLNNPSTPSLAPGNKNINNQGESAKGVVTEKGGCQGEKTQKGVQGGIRARRIIPTPRRSDLGGSGLVYGLARCFVCNAENKFSYIPGKEPVFMRCTGCGELWPFASYQAVALCNDFDIIEALFVTRSKQNVKAAGG